MRVLIFGDRNWSNTAAIVRELLILKPTLADVLITGVARGADSFGSTEYDINKRISYIVKMSEELGFGNVELFPADWEKHHRAAGPIRNQEMLTRGKPTHGLAFHHNIGSSKGTKDMMTRLERHNKKNPAQIHLELFTK